MPVTESTLKFRGCDLLLRRGGSGPPMLFLHGAGGSLGWIPFYEQLSQRFDLLVPDHPSFGKSSTPPWLEEIADLAYFYLDLLEELGLRDVHVVGHSMGGWVALEMAIRSVERFRSLTLIASAGIRVKDHPIANVFIMDRTQLMHSLFANKSLAEAGLAHTPSPEEVNELVNNQVAAARMGWSPRFFNPKLAKWLHRVSVPTQIVWGDKDQIVPPIYAKRLGELIPHATTAMIPDTGHLPFVEKTDEVTAAISSFARRNS